jgi:hypothetical protein
MPEFKMFSRSLKCYNLPQITKALSGLNFICLTKIDLSRNLNESQRISTPALKNFQFPNTNTKSKEQKNTAGAMNIQPITKELLWLDLAQSRAIPSRKDLPGNPAGEKLCLFIG